MRRSRHLTVFRASSMYRWAYRGASSIWPSRFTFSPALILAACSWTACDGLIPLSQCYVGGHGEDCECAYVDNIFLIGLQHVAPAHVSFVVFGVTLMAPHLRNMLTRSGGGASLGTCFSCSVRCVQCRTADSNPRLIFTAQWRIKGCMMAAPRLLERLTS